jgi:hypothetical protein
VTTRNEKLVELIRHHEAISAITPSASRRMIEKGDIKKVRKFLDHLKIDSFKPRTFSRVLDQKTKALAGLLSKSKSKPKWGAARKFLNLYLRRITYNFYLRRAYRLDRIEPLLELPMDSYAAKGLKWDYKALRGNREGRLPRWKGVSRLDPDSSAEFQTAARRIAKMESICRVHLDMKYWRAEPNASIRTRKR